MLNDRIKKLLIANRGEIAVRVIRTARKLGIRTVAVYSDVDADAMHVRETDEAVHIGGAAATESYLIGERILDAAARTGADAIHPGYGFLSENPDFARACVEAGVIFVGPSAESMEKMALKDAAKALMEKADVPVVPGYHGEAQDLATLSAAADEIGYPVLIKAVAGGGGKGMRKVMEAGELEAALEAARREARNAFGDDRVLVEKLITRPRHIEVQVFGDSHGDAVHLFERDCSLQRRHQKVVEEAPAPGISEAMRSALGEAAVRAARAISYEGAGTIRVYRRCVRWSRKRALLFHGNEHPPAGRAPGYRTGDRPRTWWNGSCALRQASPCHWHRTTSVLKVTPLKSGFMRKTRTMTLCPLRGK